MSAAGEEGDARTIDRATLERRVRALALPAADWVLVGSAPLLAHGLIEAVADIDLVARGAAWAQLRARPDARPGRATVDRLLRLPGAIDAFDGWLGWDADALIDGAETIGGLRYAQLETVLAFKRRLARPKDLADIAAIEAYLAAPG